jgi:hypothetical protein
LEVSVEGSRPLALALEVLEQRHGIPISYEDPKYVNRADLEDVTVKDASAHGTSTGPRVVIPRPGRIRATYELAVEPAGVADVEAAVQSVIEAHLNAGNPGIFRFARVGASLEVIAAGVRDESGGITSARSVLDSRISFPEERRTALECLNQIVDDIGQATGERIMIGAVPTNALVEVRTNMHASDSVARDVLSQLMMETGQKMSWQVFYDPGLRVHVVNIHIVRLSRE